MTLNELKEKTINYVFDTNRKINRWVTVHTGLRWWCVLNLTFIVGALVFSFVHPAVWGILGINAVLILFANSVISSKEKELDKVRQVLSTESEPDIFAKRIKSITKGKLNLEDL